MSNVHFKGEYLEDVGVTIGTYATVATSAQRICDVYMTSRRGRISAQFGKELWDTFFASLVSQFPALPTTQHLFDVFATARMLELADILRQTQRGDFGVAQKMVNLVLKDHWALSLLPPPTEAHLHLPLDRTILDKLKDRNRPNLWTSWTKVAASPQTQANVLSTYLQIQNCFRAYCQRIAPRFLSPIEMEQMLWHRI